MVNTKHPGIPKQLPISEIFYSIQGEGILVGVPSVFVRISYCNLRCRWCDTPYTSWRPEAISMSLDAIVAQVETYPCRHVVITGGEPFLFSQLPLLCERLRRYHITIETNATRYQPVRADLISLSPKLSNSTPDEKRWRVRHERLRIQPAVIRRFLDRHPCQVKFVVETPQDMEEIRRLVATIPIPREVVVLMPQARTLQELHQRGRWLVEVCKREGYRYSPRLHIELWGDQRGK